jgi:hypothetical protein
MRIGDAGCLINMVSGRIGLGEKIPRNLGKYCSVLFQRNLDKKYIRMCRSWHRLIVVANPCHNIRNRVLE